MSGHGYHHSVIFVLFFLYFGSTGFPSVIKLFLTSGSTTWSDFSSRTTITFAENPDFEIGLVLNSPFEFCTVYSTDNRADSLHRKLLSYRQNRNDAKIYSGARSSCYFNNHPFSPPFFSFFLLTHSRAVACYFMWHAREYAIRHVS